MREVRASSSIELGAGDARPQSRCTRMGEDGAHERLYPVLRNTHSFPKLASVSDSHLAGTVAGLLRHVGSLLTARLP